MTRFTKTIQHQTLQDMVDDALNAYPWSPPDIKELIRDAVNLTQQTMLTRDVGEHYIETVILYNDPTLPIKHPVYQHLGPVKHNHVTAHGLLVGIIDQPLVYAIIYADNRNRLRFYVPIKGNALNPITNDIFGEDPVADDIVAQHLGYHRYRDINIDDPAVLQSFFDMDLITNDITLNIPHI